MNLLFAFCDSQLSKQRTIAVLRLAKLQTRRTRRRTALICQINFPFDRRLKSIHKYVRENEREMQRDIEKRPQRDEKICGKSEREMDSLIYRWNVWLVRLLPLANQMYVMIGSQLKMRKPVYAD